MKVVEYEEGKYNMKYDKFFCCCESCGSMTWMDNNGDSNALEEDGEMLIEKDIWDGMIGSDGESYFCHNCEKPLKPLLFSNISKRERKKVWKMTLERRANWMKSLEIVDELEKQEEEENWADGMDKLK